MEFDAVRLVRAAWLGLYGEILMTWQQRYRARHYLANSIWILPSLSMLVAIVAAPLLHHAEEALGWKSAISPETARLVLGTMASSMFTFIVFVSSALLVAVQLASARSAAHYCLRV